MFIHKKHLKGDSLSEKIICDKALDIYGDVVSLSDIFLQCDGPLQRNIKASTKTGNILKKIIGKKNQPKANFTWAKETEIVVEEDKERDFPEVIMEGDSPSKHLLAPLSIMSYVLSE